MPARPNDSFGLPLGTQSYINGLIQDSAGDANWLSLGFSILNQAVGYLNALGVANPTSYRPALFQAVKFGIQSYIAAQDQLNSYETGQPPTHEPPFDPGQSAPYETNLTFQLENPPEELDRPIYLSIPSDHQLSRPEILAAIGNLIAELASEYELDGSGVTEDFEILTVSRGFR